MLSPRWTRGLPAVFFCVLSWTFVFAAQAGAQDTRWTWMDGGNLGNRPGVYGTQGQPHAANTPGGRQGAAQWKDGQGNLWLFGGIGYDKNGDSGWLSDLWKYDVATGEWTWVRGSDIRNAYGIYVSQGSPTPHGQPGARYRAVCWTDALGRFWLFGGDGFAASGAGAGLNDLWMYNPTTGEWTWKHGTNLRNDTGALVSGPGIDHPGNFPANAAGAVGWVDDKNNFWLFGGALVPLVGPTYPKTNALWRYNLTTNRWACLRADGAAGDYGTQNVSGPTRHPGGRYLAHAWADPQGRLYLFGGYGYATTTSTEGWLNDLWRYDPGTNRWTWIKGGNALNQNPTFSARGQPQFNNTPGALASAATWTDAQGDFWLYGGSGYSTGGDFGELCALWRYNPGGNVWTWMNGTNQTNAAPVFGTLGAYSLSNLNTPGGLHAASVWVATPNRVWLFGGEKYSAATGSTYYQAVWQLAVMYGITIVGPGGAALGGNAEADFGTAVIGTPVERTFTITNSGLNPLSGLNAVVAPLQSGNFQLLTSPAAALAPGASTNFTVCFTPAHAAPAYAAITIDDDGSLAPFVINAGGIGTLPTVALGVAPEWVWEDAGAPFVFTFTRDGPTTNPLTVSFTVSGEATLGADYTVTGADTFTATAGTVTIPSGAASATVQITPAAETVAEDEEIVRLGLEENANYTAGWPNGGEGVISSEELVIGGRDRTFYPEIIANQIFAMAAQPDGKILIGGGFSSVNGESRTNLARLHSNGTLDTSFNAPSMIVPYSVQGIVVQDDGKILVGGGAFGLSRFLANGDPDPGFTTLGGYAPISALAQQADGKILIGGFFQTIHGVARKNIARLNTDGTLDTSFDPGLGADAWVDCIAIDADGRILVGGQFTTFNGEHSPGIVRLNPIDGSVDTAFDPRGGAAVGTPMYVSGIAVQRDGRILVVGDFSTFGGEPRSRIVRLLNDGLLDPDFAATAGTNYAIESLALQADGKIILGGYFTELNGQTVPNLGRLNPDGTLDPTFQPASTVSATIWSILLLPDGRLLTGGQPSIVDEPHSGIARRANGPATQILRPFSRTIAEWKRGGAAPELARVTFDLSTDGGTNWTPLGSASPFENGWRQTGLNLPMTGHLRVRGHTGGAYRTASSSFIEEIAAFTRAGEIVVEGPGANIIAGAGGPGPWGNPTLSDGTGTVDYGLRQFPVPPIFIPGNLVGFIVHNVGNDDLTGFDVDIDGAHAADFLYSGQIGFPGATIIAPGAWKSVSINFSPKALGQRNASLHILSSDTDEPSFDVALTGFGASRRQMWRHTHFGTIAGTGSAADTADPDADGNDNNLEFYAGLNPTDPSSRYVLRLELVEGQPTHRRILFTPPVGNFVGGFIEFPDVVIQYRTSLTEGDWQPLGAPVNWAFPEWWAIDEDAGSPAKFYRIQISEE